MTEAVRLAYAEGFIAKCAEAGLDPEKIAQDAQTGATAGMQNPFAKTGEDGLRDAYAQGFMRKCAERGVDPKKVAQDALRDAAGGALSGAAVGGRGTKAAQFSLGADSNRNSALGTAGATALGTVPGIALAGLGKYQMHKATVPGFITGETGTRAGRIVMDAAKHSRGKGKLIAGLIAALAGGGAAAGVAPGVSRRMARVTIDRLQGQGLPQFLGGKRT